MNWNSYGNCKELFWLTNDILVFIDTMTNYIWVYDYNNQSPLYIFTGYAKIKNFFKKS